MSVAVITAVYGDHPPPAPLPSQRTQTAELILVSDKPHHVKGWETVVEPRSHLKPRMASKVPKARPDYYTDADRVIWLDAQFTVVSPGFAGWCLKGLGAGMVAALRHPRRQSLTAEAKAGQGREGRGRFTGQNTLAQAAHYLAKGHPDGGLWATGLLVRRMTPETVEFGRRWLEESLRWGSHDQLSFPYVAAQTVGPVVDLPWLGWSNHIFRLNGWGPPR